MNDQQKLDKHLEQLRSNQSDLAKMLGGFGHLMIRLGFEKIGIHPTRVSAWQPDGNIGHFAESLDQARRRFLKCTEAIPLVGSESYHIKKRTNHD